MLLRRLLMDRRSVVCFLASSIDQRVSSLSERFGKSPTRRHTGARQSIRRTARASLATTGAFAAVDFFAKSRFYFTLILRTGRNSLKERTISGTSRSTVDPHRMNPRMHVLELRAGDIHTVLGRLMDRIRVSGLTLVAVEASIDRDGYAVRVRLGTEDANAVERLADTMTRVVGATLIRLGQPRGR